MLKLLSRSWFSLAWTNSTISGWSTRRMPMFAPRLVPPCLTVSVAASKTVMNDTGPLAIPLVDITTSLRGRRREKLKPVPPPDLCMRAMFLTASNMPSMLSSTGSTKQAESCPRSRPAFISVGELGRNSSPDIISRKTSLERGNPFFAPVRQVRACHRGGDPLEHLQRRLEQRPLRVSGEVALLEHRYSVF